MLIQSEEGKMSLIIKGFTSLGVELSSRSYTFSEYENGIEALPRIIKWYKDSHTTCVRIVLDIAY